MDAVNGLYRERFPEEAPFSVFDLENVPYVNLWVAEILSSN